MAVCTNKQYLELHELFIKHFGPDYDRRPVAILRNAIRNNAGGCEEIDELYMELSSTSYSITVYDRLPRVIRRCVEVAYAARL